MKRYRTGSSSIAWKCRIACTGAKWHSWSWNWPDWRNNWRRSRSSRRTLRRARRSRNAIRASGVAYLCCCSASSHRSSPGPAGRPPIRPVSGGDSSRPVRSSCKQISPTDPFPLILSPKPLICTMNMKLLYRRGEYEGSIHNCPIIFSSSRCRRKVTEFRLLHAIILLERSYHILPACRGNWNKIKLLVFPEFEKRKFIRIIIA